MNTLPSGQNMSKHSRKELESFKSSYPEDVQEAWRIMIQVGEVLANPSLAKQTIEEALRDEIPQDRVRWAVDTFERWESRDERKAAARQKERERRRTKGRMEERKLTEKQFDKLDGSFDTQRLLRAVDALDAVRPTLSDQFNEDGFPRPPGIRKRLLELHGKAMELINGEFRHDTDLGVFDLAWEISDEIDEAVEYLKEVQKIIDDLTELTPDEDEEPDDE